VTAYDRTRERLGELVRGALKRLDADELLDLADDFEDAARLAADKAAELTADDGEEVAPAEPGPGEG
jgi:hypothetical protein